MTIPATDVELSRFARFHIALRFCDVFSKTTGLKVYKFELWEIYHRDELTIAHLMNKTHPDFTFIHNNNRQSKPSSLCQ